MSLVVNVDGVQCGSGSITLVDESADGSAEQIITRTITGNATIDGVSCGSISGSYQDYVTYGSGGSRTAQLSISVVLDGVTLGSATYTYTDNYGAITTAPPTPPPTPPPSPPVVSIFDFSQLFIIMIPLIALLLIVSLMTALTRRRRR